LVFAIVAGGAGQLVAVITTVVLAIRPAYKTASHQCDLAFPLDSMYDKYEPTEYAISIMVLQQNDFVFSNLGNSKAVSLKSRITHVSLS